MGTRADFYVGRGENAEWLGSIAFDGFPDGWPRDYALLECETEQSYREAVAELLKKCDHSTLPEQGWPWPWNDSRTTDYSYAFDDGSVWTSSFGYPWMEPDNLDQELEGPKVVFPDMSARKNVARDRRSGLMSVNVRGDDIEVRDGF